MGHRWTPNPVATKKSQKFPDGLDTLFHEGAPNLTLRSNPNNSRSNINQKPYRLNQNHSRQLYLTPSKESNVDDHTPKRLLFNVVHVSTLGFETPIMLNLSQNGKKN